MRPVTGADVGIRRAEIRPGLREVILCKDQDGKVGLRLREIDNVSKSKHFIGHLFRAGVLYSFILGVVCVLELLLFTIKLHMIIVHYLFLNK